MPPTESEIQQQLLTYYRRKFPHTDTQISHFSRIAEGWETEIYSFVLTHKPEKSRTHKDLILRVYPGEDALQKSEKEFHVMNQLYKMGFPVPELFTLEKDTSFLGNPFVIMEYIKGKSMWSVLAESSTQKTQELLTLFCALFRDLHTLSWEPFAADPSLYAEKDPYAWIDRWLTIAEKYVDDCKKSEFNPVVDWLDERKFNVPCERLSITHGDYHPHNVLLQNDEAFVIDWGGADISDFRMDLAWTLLLASSYGNPEYRDIILSEYERIAGFKIQQIEYFDVLACLKRLFTISVSLAEGAAKLGMRPGAEAAMKQNVEHIKRVYALLLKSTGIQIPEIEALISSLE